MARIIGKTEREATLAKLNTISERGTHRWLGLALGGASLLVFGGAVGWAVSTVLTPATDPLEASTFTYVAVEHGEVEASINLNTVATWTLVPVGANRAAGVVTGIAVAAGDEVSQGSMLYSVDQRPVVVSQGNVPAYRAIGDDAEGADVTQLQEMLAATGFYAAAIDGKAGAATVSAIKAWQKASGLPQTGVVEVGDVIFVPQLPTRVAIDPEVISRGLLVSGGEQVVRALPAAPIFSIPVTDSQATMMPTGVRVEITSPDGELWDGEVAGQTRDEEAGTVIVHLQSADGGVICGATCGQIPVTGATRLPSRIVTVESMSGLVVPSAALVTTADGQAAVIDAAGTRVPVAVVASARGMSIIEGADVGVRVRVPGSETRGEAK